MVPLYHENACSEDKNEGGRTERTKSLISLMIMLGSEIGKRVIAEYLQLQQILCLMHVIV